MHLLCKLVLANGICQRYFAPHCFAYEKKIRKRHPRYKLLQREVLKPFTVHANPIETKGRQLLESPKIHRTKYVVYNEMSLNI